MNTSNTEGEGLPTNISKATQHLINIVSRVDDRTLNIVNEVVKEQLELRQSKLSRGLNYPKR